MPGEMQVTPTLVNVSSSTDPPSKLDVMDCRNKHVSSDLARARPSAITTAAATAEPTRDASVHRANMEISLRNIARIAVLCFLLFK